MVRRGFLATFSASLDSFGRMAHVAVLALLWLISPAPALAQDIQPTPEQLRLFEQLPPAQQRQLMNEYLKMQRGGGRVGRVSTAADPAEESAEPLQDEPLFLLEDQLEEIRIEGGETLVVTLQFKEEASAGEKSRSESDPVIGPLVGSRNYRLDAQGVIDFPGLARIPLLGLTAEQAGSRIGSEPALAGFDVLVTILELTRTGRDGLQPFGVSLFATARDGFAPATDIPVPSDYVLGPGDNIRVQLYGKLNEIYEFTVTRDGVLNLPELGPVNVAGLSFSEFREDLRRRVEQMLIGTRASVTMGELRSIQVFVLGDAAMPGSYTVSGLATMTNALFASGGVSAVGSMRGIQLKRQGKVVGKLDMYDLLLRGNTAGDARLQPGDVVFVPPTGPTVGVAGAVKRPAIYELKSESTVQEVLDLAGGLLPNADPGKAKLERLDKDGLRTVLGVDLAGADARSMSARNGDVLDVPAVIDAYNMAVRLEGHVHRPGVYSWRPGMRLSRLIQSPLELKDGADLNYVLVRRINAPDLSVEAVSASLLAALSNPGGEQDLLLQPRDTIHVFALEFGRQRVVQPLLAELRRQARRGEDLAEITVDGQVRAPGSYPLEPDMRISDLIRAGGDLTEQAFALQAELTRYVVVGQERREVQVMDIDLQALLGGDESSDIALQPHDHLIIKGIPEWDADWIVELKGEFKFPGRYPIRRGETLAAVIDRAGGLNHLAFPEGAIFLREELKQREKEQLEVLARRLESDLASLSLAGIEGGQSEALSVGKSLLTQLRQTEPVGRLVIDLDTLVRTGQQDVVRDIELKDGDRILVPRRSQEVTVLGEVQYATSHIYAPGLSRDEYIAQSGGLTRKADKSLIYVVRANGSVVAGNTSRWFGGGGNVEIRPGDSIVVPLDTDRIRPLTFWGSVTQILYQGALAVAAVKTFNN